MKPTGLTNSSKTRRFTDADPGMARQEAADQVVVRVWSTYDAFLVSKPGLLASYPDLLLSLFTTISTNIKIESSFL
jgi:hypothetical protein